MENKKIFNMGDYKIELVVPDQNKGLKGAEGNNIEVFDKNGLFLWNISELLKTYSDKNGFNYYDELYFDVRLLDNQNIFCIGFTNHCEIDLKTGSIIKIVNNR